MCCLHASLPRHWELGTLTNHIFDRLSCYVHKFSLRIHIRSCFRLISWRRKRSDLRDSYNQAVRIDDVTMLSSCLSQWKSLYRKSRMLQVSCDHLLELKQTKLQRNLWVIWFRTKEKVGTSPSSIPCNFHNWQLGFQRDIEKMRLHNLVLNAAKNWRRYAINGANNRRIKEERLVSIKQFKCKWLCKIYFSYWHLQYKVCSSCQSFCQSTWLALIFSTIVPLGGCGLMCLVRSLANVIYYMQSVVWHHRYVVRNLWLSDNDPPRLPHTAWTSLCDVYSREIW